MMVFKKRALDSKVGSLAHAQLMVLGLRARAKFRFEHWKILLLLELMKDKFGNEELSEELLGVGSQEKLLVRSWLGYDL